MKLIAAWIQVIIVFLVVGYGTWKLFEGEFAQSFATLPFLFAYYVFVIARLRRKSDHTTEDPDDS
jgi:hypothetical protein